MLYSRAMNWSNMVPCHDQRDGANGEHCGIIQFVAANQSSALASSSRIQEFELGDIQGTRRNAHRLFRQLSLIQCKSCRHCCEPGLPASVFTSGESEAILWQSLSHETASDPLDSVPIERLPRNTLPLHFPTANRSAQNS
jgi:hypothetical protein